MGSQDKLARVGTLKTSRGEIATPCFMPVGTRGSVRSISSQDLEDLDASIILANTYHMMLRPGAEIVSELGGLHGFTGWNRHFLTDSGGYQVFSLSGLVDDEGVTFRSTYDGSYHRFTPEKAVLVQELLGADIQMVLDVCLALPADTKSLRLAVERTLQWADRAKKAHSRPGQALFGIVQGGTNTDLRTESALGTVDIDFDGYAIGGLSVGEGRAEMLEALEAAINVLPLDQPRYLMGLGDPLGIIEAVSLGVDMFDSVLPTRLARHGSIFTSQGRLNLKNAAYVKDPNPLDPNCSCSVCSRWSRSYLRHLLMVSELSAQRLLTIHNLFWLLGYMKQISKAIEDQSLEAFRNDMKQIWS